MPCKTNRSAGQAFLTGPETGPAVALLLPVFRPGPELLRLAAALTEDRRFLVLVVDDGSGPAADAVLRALPAGVVCLRHDAARGKGAAMKTGFAYLLEHCPHLLGVVVADSDGQHDLANLRAAAAPLYERKDAIVLGCRTFHCRLPLRTWLGSLLLHLAFSGACNLKIADTLTDLRAYPSRLLPALLEVSGERYDYATNVLLWASREKIEIMEAPLPTPYTDGRIPVQFQPVRDSLRIFSRVFKFAMASFTAFCVDYALVLLLRPLTRGWVPDSVSLLVAVAAARMLSACVSFTMNRRLVFHSKERLLPMAVKYFTIILCILTVNYWILYVLHLLLELPLWLAKCMTEVSLFFVNYALQTRLVFKTKQ